MKWLHPRGVIDGLITARVHRRGDKMRCLANMSQTTRPRVTASQRKIADIAFEVVVSVTGVVFYDV